MCLYINTRSYNFSMFGSTTLLIFSIDFNSSFWTLFDWTQLSVSSLCSNKKYRQFLVLPSEKENHLPHFHVLSSIFSFRACTFNCFPWCRLGPSATPGFPKIAPFFTGWTPWPPRGPSSCTSLWLWSPLSSWAAWWPSWVKGYAWRGGVFGIFESGSIIDPGGLWINDWNDKPVGF